MLLRLMKKKATAAHRRVESSLGGNGGRFEEEEEEEHLVVVWKTSFSVLWKWFRGWWRGTLKRLAGPTFLLAKGDNTAERGRRTDIALR